MVTSRLQLLGARVRPALFGQVKAEWNKAKVGCDRQWDMVMVT